MATQIEASQRVSTRSGTSVTGTRPHCLGSQCSQPALGASGPLCLPTISHFGQSGGEVTQLPVQRNHSDCSKVAQCTLVLGLSGQIIL